MGLLPQAGQSGPLERYARILEVLAAYPDGLLANDIERILDLPKSTVNRLLNALLASDLVSVEGRKNASYVIGDRLNRVLRSETGWIQIATQRLLRDLASDLQETCFVSRRFGGSIQSVAMQSPDASVGIYVTPGHDLPWYATASGKLLTAMSSDELLGKGDIVPFTSHTIVNQTALAHEFGKIRESGFAEEFGEHILGLATLALHVPTDQMPHISYGLGVTGPHARMIVNKPEMLKTMKKAIPQLSAILSMRKAPSMDETPIASPDVSQ